MLASRRGRQRHRLVQVVGHAQIDDVDVGALEHPLQIGVHVDNPCRAAYASPRSRSRLTAATRRASYPVTPAYARARVSAMKPVPTIAMLTRWPATTVSVVPSTGWQNRRMNDDDDQRPELNQVNIYGAGRSLARLRSVRRTFR